MRKRTVEDKEKIRAARDLLLGKMSSRNFLLRLLRKRIFGGKEAAQDEVRALVERVWPTLLSGTNGDAALRHGVGVFGFFHAEIGIGQSARRSALSFKANDYPISCHSIPLPGSLEERVRFDASLDLGTPFDTVLLHLNADTLTEVAPTFPEGLLERRRAIGFWHWELPVFPARWASAFDLVDELWAPSLFTAASIATATDKPVHVVPHAIPRILVDPSLARHSIGLPPDDFIVLATFDSSSWTARKNPAGTIKAFLDAFPRGHFDSARLVFKVHGRAQRDEVFDEFLRLAGSDDRISVIDQVYSPEQMVWLQNACDVYLSLHRSEGYGLNIAECMAVGKLAIATNFSGNVDFMNAQNSIPIPYRMRAVGPGEYLHGDGQWWADPDHDVAVDALRLAYKRSAATEKLARNGMDDIEFYNSFERVGRISIATLEGRKFEHDRRPACAVA